MPLSHTTAARGDISIGETPSRGDIYDGDVPGVSTMKGREHVHEDLLTNAPMLSLLYDIAASSVHNIHLARVTIDWLRGVCDDVCANNEMVMKTVGVVPLLIILSLWSVGGGPPQIGSERGSETEEKTSDREVYNENENWEKSVLSFSISLSDGNRLQQSCSRFLKQLLTGTSGDQSVAPGGDSPRLIGPGPGVGPGAWGSELERRRGLGGGARGRGDLLRSSSGTSSCPPIPGGAATSTGFTVQSMTHLFGFLLAMHG